MSRQQPWRQDHPDAVRIDRATRWGNPFKVGEDNPLGFGQVTDRQHAVSLFEQWWALRLPLVTVARSAHTWQHAHIRELRGHDLACWCPLPADGEPDVCHGAVLLSIANAPDLTDTDPMGDPDTRRAAAALAEWGCPRPDKRHYLLRESADAALARLNALEVRAHELEHLRAPDEHCDLCRPHRPRREVYRCRCGGLAIGHPRPTGEG